MVEYEIMVSMEVWISSQQSMAPSLTGLITTPTKRVSVVALVFLVSCC